MFTLTITGSGLAAFEPEACVVRAGAVPYKAMQISRGRASWPCSPAGGDCRCRGRIKAEVHGARVRKGRGAPARNRWDRGRPILKTFCAAARTGFSSCCRADISAASASRWCWSASLAIWGMSGFYRVQSEELGVVLRFGKYVRDGQPGLNYHLPYPIETVLLPKALRVSTIQHRHDADRRSGAARPDHARRAGREPDADRRREYRRRRFHRVVADQAEGRRRFPVQHPESRKAP